MPPFEAWSTLLCAASSCPSIHFLALALAVAVVGLVDWVVTAVSGPRSDSWSGTVDGGTADVVGLCGWRPGRARRPGPARMRSVPAAASRYCRPPPGQAGRSRRGSGSAGSTSGDPVGHSELAPVPGEGTVRDGVVQAGRVCAATQGLPEMPSGFCQDRVLTELTAMFSQVSSGSASLGLSRGAWQAESTDLVVQPFPEFQVRDGLSHCVVQVW